MQKAPVHKSIWHIPGCKKKTRNKKHENSSTTLQQTQQAVLHLQKLCNLGCEVLNFMVDGSNTGSLPIPYPVQKLMCHIPGCKKNMRVKSVGL